MLTLRCKRKNGFFRDCVNMCNYRLNDTSDLHHFLTLISNCRNTILVWLKSVLNSFLSTWGYHRRTAEKIFKYAKMVCDRRYYLQLSYHSHLFFPAGWAKQIQRTYSSSTTSDLSFLPLFRVACCHSIRAMSQVQACLMSAVLAWRM